MQAESLSNTDFKLRVTHCNKSP